MSAPNILGGTEQETKPFPWTLAIGAALVVLAIGVTVAVTYKPARQEAPPPPYAASLELSDMKMATANNYVGGTVTDLEGNVRNGGGQTVTGVLVELTFLDGLNQVVQRERLPLRLTEERPGYSDTVEMARAPLGPGQMRAFRITLEHVSSDWNGAYPGVRVVDVLTK